MRRFLCFAVILCLMLSFVSCSGVGNEIKAGSVKILAGGDEYTPFQNIIFSQQKDGTVMDSARKTPQEAEDDLPLIPYHNDMQIIIDGESMNTPSYTLYGSAYEEIYYRMPEFALPDEPGSYIVSFELAWGNEEEFEGYQYWFAISWPEQSDAADESSYPKQAGEYLRQSMDGSVLVYINRAKDEGHAAFQGMNYSDAGMSPDGNKILCKTDAYDAGEARWSGYSVIDLTTKPTEIYSFDGEQWGFQNHIFLSDDLIGFASGAVIGGQEDTWESIQLFDSKYNPIDIDLQFPADMENQITGIGYIQDTEHYIVSFAKDFAISPEMPFSTNKLCYAMFSSDGKLIDGRWMELPDEYIAPYSNNLLMLIPNNPVVTADGRILLRAQRDNRNVLLIVDPYDLSVQVEELPYGEALRLSADGNRAFAAEYNEQSGALNPIILDFSQKADTIGLPDMLFWEVEGYPGKFYPIDAVMRDNHIYVMAENYTEDGDLYCGLFYWDRNQAELLRIFPGRSYCSLAGVDGEGFCYVMLHGMYGDEYMESRDYAKTLLGEGEN